MRGRVNGWVQTITLLAMLGWAYTAWAGVVSVDWDDATTSPGDLNGITVNFLASGLRTTANDSAGPDYDAAPILRCTEIASYDTGSDWTATFSEPVANLLLYAHFWRGSADGVSPVTYAFDQPFTILSGLGSATVSDGNTVLSLPDNFHDGILQFTGPVTSLSVETNTTSPAAQSLTFGLTTGTPPPEDEVLDTSFSFDGKVTTGFGVATNEEARAIVIQSDGKIVAAGVSDAGGSDDFALARYNTDGSPDDSFGSNALVFTDFSEAGSSDEANALNIQTDGKILAAGESNANGSVDFALARYNTDGTLDDGFGTGGLVLTDFSDAGSNDQASALAIQSDGKILVAGTSDANGSRDFALARYNPDGSLDNGFGSDGLVVTDISGTGSFDAVDALAIQSDGKIVAAGVSDAGGSFDFALARYNADGSLDDSFGSDGLVLTDPSGGGLDEVEGLALQSDGKIVAAGRSDVFESFDFALARYNTDGSLDSSFGSDGVVFTNFCGFNSDDSASALTIGSDGTIVVVGISNANGSDDFALARYNADGNLDDSFGSDDLILTDFSGGGSLDQAFSMTIQSDGKILAAGSSFVSENFDFALARYLDSAPAPSPSPTPMPGIEPGDANADGEINILDVTAILNDILVISSASGNGDCNEDGEVNILDVTCVLNIILGG